MYDDLARSQRQSALEWLVLNALIPSVLVTLALPRHSSYQPPPRAVRHAFMCTLTWTPIPDLPAIPMPAGVRVPITILRQE